MADIPIDWLNVDWLYVAVLAVFVFLTTMIGNLIALHHRLMGAVLSAVLFAVAFVFWSYYPHHLPLPTRLGGDKAAATTTPTATPAAPTQRPRNPITDITPPRNPITDVTPPANPPQR